MGGSGGSECKYLTASIYGDGRDYHDRWYRLYTGLTGGASGTVYRLHTTSTDPSNVAQQRNTNGESSFAIYASASGGTPKVYGLGAMQMFTPLSASGGSTFSEFYMAQVEAVHAGKTMEIKLWDPGDTNPLSANLQIEIPTASGWSPTNVDWSSTVGTSASGTASCNGRSGSGVTSIVTVQPDRAVQRLLADDRRRHPGRLHRPAERVVEDQVQHERVGHIERRHDLEGPDQGQSGPPDRPLTRDGRLTLRCRSCEAAGGPGGFVAPRPDPRCAPTPRQCAAKGADP